MTPHGYASPRIIAHRGASFDAPENTVAALRLGFAQGADAGECDVRMTADGHAVLMHDADTRRTTGVARLVEATSLAELRALGVALDTARPRDVGVGLMSFDRAVTKAARGLFPDLELHQLSEWRAETTAEELVAEAKTLGVQGLNLDQRFAIDAGFVAAAREAELTICVWTVDEPSRARTLAAAGVDALTTNRPGWLREKIS
ncbi:MAG: hypothetical protein MUE42_12030 [Opitutaceae bacterium]|nr:hypothetical protein [Opitutaceae bacterium]